MDAEKTGRLIRWLREEKGMTQVQLGERLHISHKTVESTAPFRHRTQDCGSFPAFKTDFETVPAAVQH